MKLQRAQIVNFRSIQEAWIDFTPSWRTLVGSNESGKSNVIKALSLLDKDAKASPDDVREILPDESPASEAFVRFFFTLPAKTIATIGALVKKQCAFVDPDEQVVALGEMECSLWTLLGRSNFSLTVHLRNGRREWEICPESEIKLSSDLFIPETGANIGLRLCDCEGVERLLNQFRLIESRALPSDAEQFVRRATVEDVRSAINASVAGVCEQSVMKCVRWSYSPEHVLPGKVSISQFKNDPSRCAPLQQMFMIAGHDDVSETIADAERRPNGLRNLLNRVATCTTQYVRNVWPEAKDTLIALQPNGSDIDCSVMDKSNYYDMSKRSDGYKRFVTFMILVSSRSRFGRMQETLLLLDEPDLGLHPAGVRFLRNEIASVSAANYVVVATHSVFLIDQDRIDRHILVSKQNERTSLQSAPESDMLDEEVLFRALGYSMFDQLAGKVLVFEGWRDKRLFRTALNAWRGDAAVFGELKRLGVCHACGAKDIAKVSSVFEAIGRKVCILSDGDTASVERQRRYVGDGAWFTYADVDQRYAGWTAEDFLVPREVALALESVLVRYGHDGSNASGEFAFSIEHPVMEQIGQYLRRLHIEPERAKEIVSDLKALLFDEIGPERIAEEYYAMLSALNAKINQGVE